MSLRQRTATALVWSAAQAWGLRAVTFVVLLVLARHVAPEAFGLVAMASVVTAFAQIFLDQGFSDAIVQRPELENQHLDTAFWTNTLASVLLTAACMAMSGLIARLFHEPALAPVVRSLSLSFLFGALSSVQEALLRRRLAFKSLALRSLVATVSGGVVAVIMAFLGFGVWSLVARALVSGLTGTIALWQASHWRPHLSFSLKHFRELFAFGASMVGSSFVDFFNRRADDLLIGFFLGATALGYYTLAYNLLLMMTDAFASVPNNVLFPAFSRLQKDTARMQRSFYEITQWSSIVALPAFIGVAVLAREFVTALYGPAWAPSVPAVQVLMFVGILHSACYFFGDVIKAAGKPAWRLGILSLTAVLNVAGFAIAVRWGITAVAVSYALVGYLVAPFYFLLVRRLIQVNPGAYLRQYVPALIGSLAMVAAVLGLQRVLAEGLGLIPHLITCVVAGGLAYLVALTLAAPSLPRRALELAHLVLPASRSRQA